MSSNAFRDWARAEGIETSAPLDQLKGAVVAIDADEYLNNLLVSPATHEPLLPALGGLPFALQKHVNQDLHHFEQVDIQPIFVFGGIELAAKDHAALSRESRKQSRALQDAWSIYDDGRGEAAVVQFGKACSYSSYHIRRWLQTYLRRKNVAVQNALYTASAQIAYLVDDNQLDAAFGSVDCLLYGLEKVVTHFDWEEKRFRWVELNQCLSKTSLTKEQFYGLMLVSGCSLLPPLPEIDTEPAVARVSAARSLLGAAGQDAHAACLNAKDEDYVEAFMKARSVFKHPVLLHENGKVELKDPDSAPNDIHFFIGQRLPAEVYYYLFNGIVGPRVLSWRTRNQVYEAQPLDGGSSQTYRDLVQTKLRPLKSQSLALLTRLLHRYYQNTDVDLVCWFKEDEKKALGISELFEDAVTNANSWHLIAKDFPAGNSANQFATPLTYAIDSLANETIAKKTVTPHSNSMAGLLGTSEELLGNTVWRFLHDRGYINPDHTLSAWGKALKVALDRARKDWYLTSTSEEGAEEAIIMAFELLRVDLLNARSMFPTPPYSGAPLRGSEADKSNTLLISRIAALGSFHHADIGYTGPLSRHLLAYHQIAAALRQDLRDLVEMHACYMLLSGVVRRDLEPKALAHFGTTLPFLREPDLGLALVVKSYLDELSSDPAKRSDVKKWFNHATDIPGDLARAWKLWAAINAGVQAADSSIINNETRKTFKTADDWLQQKLSSDVNGKS